MFPKEALIGTSLAVQWLRRRASNAGGAGLVPGGGTKIPHAARPKKQKERKKNKEALITTLKYQAQNSYTPVARHAI